jgi:branched-chain amino acid transport system substrate-binding protein
MIANIAAQRAWRYAMKSRQHGRGRGSRLVLRVALLLVTALTAGCGSRLDTQEIVNALAPTATQGAQAADAALSQGSATEQTPTNSGAATGRPTTSTSPGVAADPAKTAAKTGATPVAGQVSPIGGSAPAKGAGSVGAAAAEASTVRSAGSRASGSATRSSPRSTLVFGNIGSYTGLLGTLTEGNKYALSAWASMQNARGGLDGHPIKLVIGDDRSDPVSGLTLMKRMVENDHVLAFVSNIHVFGVDQYADYAKSKGVPFIGGDAVGGRWYTDPNMFPAVGPTTGAIQAGLQYFIKQGMTRLGMTYCLEVAKMCGYLNDTTMKSPVGKNIVADEQVSLVAPSYTSQCLRMQSNKIEAIYLLMDTAGAARFVQNCATQGYKPKVMVLGLDATAEFPRVDAMQGALVPGATVPPSETQIPAVAEYRAAMNKYAPGIGDSGCGLLGWAGGLLLGRAGEHLPDNPTAADFKATLWKIKNDDLGGFTTPLTFPKDKPAIPSTCLFLWGSKDHKFYAPQGPKALC